MADTHVAGQAPPTLAAHQLTHEHVGRVIELPDGTTGVLLQAPTVVLVLDDFMRGPGFTRTREVAPSAPMTVREG